MSIPASARRAATPLPLPLYAAGLVVLLMGPWCALHLLTLPGFLNLVVGLILLGVPVSLWLRAHGVNRAWVSRGVTAAMLVGGLGFLALHPQSYILLGGGRTFSSSLLFSDGITPLLHFIAWVIAFRSFALLTDTDVLLMIVPGLSMIILVAILETSAHVFLFLVPFSVSSLFLVMRHHEARLRTRTPVVIGRPPQTWRRDLGSLGSLCLVIAVLATGLSALLADLTLPKEIIDRCGLQLATYFSRLLIVATRQPYVSATRYLDVGEGQPPQGATVLFRVATQYPMRWRGNVFNTYNSRGWQVQMVKPDRILERQTANSSLQKMLPDPYEDYQRGSRVLVDHEFTLAVYCQGLLVAAYEPIAVTLDNVSLKTDPLRRLSCLRLSPGTRYEVRTSVKQVSGMALRGAKEDLPPAIQATYLSLPPDLPERVRDYARGVCGGADNPYDRLRRLEIHLAETHTYTLTTPSIPEDRDVVDHFVFEMKEGSCLHFATALAVLGRVVGVPTRLVTGYNPGAWDSRSARYEVRDRDAHAWVEAYFAGYGWIEFDPTGLTAESVSRWKVALLSLRKWSQQWAMNAGRWLSLTEDRLQERCGRVWPLLGGAGLALLTLVGVWRREVRRRSAPTLRPPVVRDRARRQSFRQFDSLCALLRRYGLPRYGHETPFEYAAAVAACVPSVAAQVEVIVQTYVAGRYSDESLSPEQIQASAQAWRTLLPHLRAARRATPRGEWGRRAESEG